MRVEPIFLDSRSPGSRTMTIFAPPARRPAGGRPQKFTNFAPYRRRLSMPRYGGE
jgi:hypothetical protein